MKIQLDPAAEQIRPTLEYWLEHGTDVQKKAAAFRLNPFARADPPAHVPAPLPYSVEDDGRLRVGFIAPCTWHGGAENHQLSVIRSIDKSSIRVVGVATPSESGSPSMMAAMNAAAPLAHGWAACRALASLCDVVVTWAVPEVPKFVAGLASPPVVVSVCHAPDCEYGRGIYSAGVDHIKKFVAVSKLAVAPIPADRRADAVVIENAIDPSRLVPPPDGRDGARRRLGIDSGKTVYLYLGRLSHEKEPAAMKRLALARPDSLCVVAGEGWEMPAMQDGRPDNLLLIGANRNIAELFAASDVLIVPSLYESFCLTMAEGMAYGIPIVSTDVGVAAMHPSTTVPIPFLAPGDVIARAADEATGGWAAGRRVQRARRLALDLWGDPDRFGRQWTKFLLEAADRPVAKAAPSYPGYGRMATNLIGSFARHVAKGMPTVPDAAFDARVAVCKSCDQYVKESDRCQKCGCYMMSSKARMAGEECPLKKWTAYDPKGEGGRDDPPPPAPSPRSIADGTREDSH